MNKFSIKYYIYFSGIFRLSALRQRAKLRARQLMYVCMYVYNIEYLKTINSNNINTIHYFVEQAQIENKI